MSTLTRLLSPKIRRILAYSMTPLMILALAQSVSAANGIRTISIESQSFATFFEDGGAFLGLDASSFHDRTNDSWIGRPSNGYNYLRGMTFFGNDTSAFTASGYLGIGTSTPSAKFEVVGGDAIINGVSIGRGGGGNIFSHNTAIGEGSLLLNIAGTYNTAVGNGALLSNISGGFNIAVGESALYSNNGNENVGIGNFALQENQGEYNMGIGNSSLQNNQGDRNIGIGYDTAINVEGSNNTILGYSAASTLTGGSNNIVIGYEVDTPSTISSNTLNIGNLIFGTGIDGTGTTLSSGNIGIGTSTPSQKLEVAGSVLAIDFLYSSDKRLKKYITPLEGSLAKLLKLRGYSYAWKSSGVDDIGVIAQDVEAVYPTLVHTDPSSGMKSVQYGNLIAPLIESIREQQAMIEKQAKLIQALQVRMEALEKR